MNNDLSKLKLPVVEIGLENNTIIKLSVVIFIIMLVGILLNVYISKNV